MIWAFLAALALLFWLPELILYMGWAKFWIVFTTQAFIGRCSRCRSTC